MTPLRSLAASSRLARLSGLALLAAGLAAPAAAQLQLPAVFADAMVLQRNAQAPVWGTDTPGQLVRVLPSWTNQEFDTTADADGRFSVRISTPGAGGPHTVRILGSTEIELRNVLTGDVWIASGQSNMEMPIDNIRPGYSGVLNYEQELQNALWPQIRFFTTENRFALRPAQDVVGEWKFCSPGYARFFSGTAYFFARKLHQELDVPIGILSVDWGGSVAEAWVSLESLATTRDFADDLMLLIEAMEDPDGLEARWDRLRTAFWTEMATQDQGSVENWQSFELDESAWQTIELPGVLESDNRFNGTVWYRRSFIVAPGDADQEWVLELGPIDDMDTTFVNGERIGGLEREGLWQTPRVYRAPRGVIRPGRNVIAVRVLDTGGASGFTAARNVMRIRTPDESRTIPLEGAWRYRASSDLENLPPWPDTSGIQRNSPTVLYNAMLAPLAPFAVKGAIWYQGESNRTRARQYRWLFPMLIHDWRQHFEQGDFPFYFAQIAPYNYSGDTGQAAELREAQLFALSTLNTGMACTMDIGNPFDIHPKNKQEVGRRLALQALRKTYGHDVVADGPLYRGLNTEGSSLRIQFTGAAGLNATGPLQHFEIAGVDRVWHDANAHIEGETVVVSKPGLTAPVAVRYAWGAGDQVNLRNGEGLPAAGFRTHEW